MVIELLRSVTRTAHEDLERTIQPVIAGIHTPADYARLLRVFYGFYKPLYSAIVLHLDQQLLPDFPTRRQPGWLLDDLQTLGLGDESIAVDPDCPMITDNDDAFAALYVMEGSTLGGKIICKMIAEKLPGLPAASFSFFRGYAGETGNRWKRFLEALEIAGIGGSPERMARTATHIFEEFHQWIDKAYVPGSVSTTKNEFQKNTR